MDALLIITSHRPIGAMESMETTTREAEPVGVYSNGPKYLSRLYFSWMIVDLVAHNNVDGLADLSGRFLCW